MLRDRAERRTRRPSRPTSCFSRSARNPRTDWLPETIERDEQGFVLTGADVPRARAWPLERDPHPLETSMPGVLAVGDARHGSIKRVASAVGEGSVAIRVLHRLLDPAAEGRTAIDVAESPA